MKTNSSLFKSVDNRLRRLIAESRDLRVRDRKIVVFESDDWGAIRVPSKDVHDTLIELGYDLDSRPYERFDGLERDEDVVNLANLLKRFTDTKGNHPIFTLNYLSGNPCFEAIGSNGFKAYQWESIEKTYKTYNGGERVIEIVKQGEKDGVFDVQFHGREHFDVEAWMEALRKGDEDVMTAFEYGMCGIFPKTNPSIGNKYMIAFKKLSDSRSILREGYDEFCRIWGKKPKSFIAPCYTWPNEMEDELFQLNIEVIQGSRFQKEFGCSRNVSHWIGERNQNGMAYTIRNCSFEPSTTSGDIVANTVAQVERCFRRNVPAIISTHRINYTSRISKDNAINNLKMLDSLLEELMLRHPSLEFVTSDKLLSI